jgi:hypothetical protein
MKYLILIGFSLLACLLQGPVAHASSDAKLKVDIYPLDCVFEYVNDGSNQIVYITPKECGQQVVTVTPGLDGQGMVAINPQEPSSVPGTDLPIDIGIERPSASNDLINSEAAETTSSPNGSRTTVALILLIVGVVAIGVGVGVDFLIFEFQFSKLTAQWARGGVERIGRVVTRRPKP